MIVDTLSFLDLKLLFPLIRFVQVLLVAISYPPGNREFPEQTIVTDEQTFDFVVVGAGSAGCVLASRLTEVGDWSVLLIEAGTDPPFVAQNPLLSVFAHPAMPEWNYFSEDDNYTSQARETKTIHHITGKMLGGSSSLNYMYHVRGNQADYDEWAQLGNVGWNWENVQQYFKKSERVEEALRSNSRGSDGYIGVTKQDWEQRTGVYLKAFEENGHAVLADYNSGRQMGYSAAQFFIMNATRQSTAETYLKAAKNRPNLHVLKKSLVRKVVIDSNKIATGVEVSLHDGKIVTVKTRKEVILSAGAVNSPKLLMLSGVGPEDHLTEMGIKVIHNSINVGENLQDHMMIYIMFTGKGGFSTVVKNVDLLLGWGMFPIPTLLGFAALNKTQSYPDYQATVCPLPAGHPMSLLICKQILNFDEKTCNRFIAEGKRREHLNALLTLLSPESRGRIKLRSSNPEDKPLIYNGYFSSDKDLDNFVKYLKDYLSVIRTKSLRKYGSKTVNIGIKQCEHLTFESDEYWRCYILNTVASQYHLSGTCFMGPNDEAVVDEKLKVKGIESLRVVDASIMPKITSGNINAPIIMIAEKASDMIKENWLSGM